MTAAGLPAADLPVALHANSVNTVLLLDRDGRLVAELHDDGVGSARVPVGAIDAGVATDPPMWSAGLAMLLAGVAGGALVARVRRAGR